MKTLLYKFTGAAIAAALFFLCLPAAAVQAAATPESDRLAETYLVMDAETGQVLLANGPDVAKYPASITKIVTLALVQEAINDGTIDWDTNTTVSQAAVDALIPEASTAGIVAGEVVSVRDMVYLTQIRSANECANVLAELLGGSIEGFAAMMNTQVAVLGLTGTHFTNPSGLPDKNHYTTAYDMGQLTRWALSVPGFAEIFAARDYTMAPTNMYNSIRVFEGTNAMWWDEGDYYYEDLTGAKSGYTDAAAYTFVAAAERDGMQLLCVVLRCENNDDKYIVTQELLEYSFNNFRREQFTLDGLETLAVPVYGGGTRSLGDIDVYGVESFSFLLHNSLSVENDVTVTYDVPESYVLGQDFAPAARLNIGDGSLQYAEAFNVRLGWSGLDDVFTGATDQSFAHSTFVNDTGMAGAKALPIVGLVVLSLVALVVLLVCARLIQLQLRRLAQRQQELAAQKERLESQSSYRRRLEKYGRITTTVRPDMRVSRGRPNTVHLQVVSRQRQPQRRAGQR